MTRPPSRIPQRAQAIQRTVARYKVATTSQIRRLHYQGLTPGSQEKLSHRNLKTLTDLGLLRRVPYVYKSGGAEAEYVYTSPQSTRMPKPHLLDTVELYVRFSEVLGPEVPYVPEPSSHIKIGDLTSEADALLELSETRKFFIEVDRDQEHPARLRSKMRHYVNLYGQWDKQKHGPRFPLVIWVAHDSHRVSDLRREIKAMPDSHIFTSMLFDEVVPRLT